jgi:hypothetical protein
MMASDMAWTTDLGNAVLQQRADVMDAIQRMRRKAKEYGYLRSNDYIVVSGGPFITIEPVNPDFIVVPAYDPLVVFAPPPPGFFVGGAIAFGFGVRLGAWFRPWGWRECRIGWGEHAIFINNVRWERGWRNRAVYVQVIRGFIAGCTRTASNITNYSAAVPRSAPPLAVVLLSVRHTIVAESGCNKVGKQTRLRQI